MRNLMQREADRQRLRELLLDGAKGPVVVRADEKYFTSLRDRVRGDAGPPARSDPASD